MNANYILQQLIAIAKHAPIMSITLEHFSLQVFGATLSCNTSCISHLTQVIAVFFALATRCHSQAKKEHRSSTVSENRAAQIRTLMISRAARQHCNSTSQQQ